MTAIDLAKKFVETLSEEDVRELLAHALVVCFPVFDRMTLKDSISGQCNTLCTLNSETRAQLCADALFWVNNNLTDTFRKEQYNG